MAGFTTIGFCEIDPFCQKVLRKNFPDVPIHGDIKTLDANIVDAWLCGKEVSSGTQSDADEPVLGRGIDIVTGGFP